jgi:hypothetical protein
MRFVLILILPKKMGHHAVTKHLIIENIFIKKLNLHQIKSPFDWLFFDPPQAITIYATK